MEMILWKSILLLHEFREWAEKNHWHIRVAENKAVLPEEVTERYAVPAEWLMFISDFECCSNLDDTVWFLTCEDYQNQKAFRWNEWELLSLESAQSETELSEIMQFWNQHFPVILSVKDGYAYYAVNTADGSIISGSEPEFENSEIIADSFADFMQKIISGDIIL